jgi:hypothetical protein
LLIAAIESREIEQAELLARECGIERMSLQPEFCCQWNQHASFLAKNLAVFATAGEHHMVASIVEAGSITAISYGSVQPPAADLDGHMALKSAVDDRVDRLLSIAGHEHAQVQGYFLAPWGTQELALNARWQVLDAGKEVS